MNQNGNIKKLRYLPLLFTGVLGGCITSPDDMDREMDAFVQN